MRVLQLIQKPQSRGAEIFAGQLSNHLLDRSHQVRTVALFDGNSPFNFRSEMTKLGLRSRRIFDFRGWRMLANEINGFKPDVVQANAGDTLKYAVLSKLAFGWSAPIVFRNANKVSDFIDTILKRWFNRFLVNRVQQVISVSELCRQDFINTYSYNPSKTITIPIGIEIASVQPGLPENLNGIFEKSRVLIHVASYVTEKNHIGLLRIFKSLTEDYDDVNLVLVGDGRLRQEVKEKIRKLDLTSRVHVLGYRSDVLTLMQHAAVCVLPSLIEGLPGVILEAMYCRTPVVAYDVGGISEVVKNNETGWLVKKGNEDGFVKAVGEVLEGKDLDRMTSNAYELVVKEYDNKVIAKRFEAVYRQVMERG
ncbi:glycosyltransferase family 4 protein [Oscillatoria amoena NRMC-F 0135]|nr:glycosyltransferase family 4 protein [Oscillatoria amoena NRMC-F 0135]